MERTIQIRKPNDSYDNWQTKIKIEGVNTSHLGVSNQITYVRTAKDPVHQGIVNWWKTLFSSRGRRYYGRFPKEYEMVITIQTLPIVISKNKTRYSINGQTESANTIHNVLARVLYKSIFTQDAAQLMKSMMDYLATPEEVKYCLENRLPYHFFDDFVKKDCRLNIMQIGKDECAIELSDGLWGTLKNKELLHLYSFYALNKKRNTKWSFVSPQKLFEYTVGRTPSEAESILMVEFLQQNRTRDIVEKRALQLVNDLLAQHGERLRAVWKDNQLQTLFVKGKDYDWKLVSDPYKSNIQMVSTYVWQPKYSSSDFDELLGKHFRKLEETEDWNAKNPEKAKPIPERPTNEYTWKGPICIDNMAPDSPIGDQFGARALALLNDTMTIKIVNTIKRYLVTNKNVNRIDLNEMR